MNTPIQTILVAAFIACSVSCSNRPTPSKTNDTSKAARESKANDNDDDDDEEDEPKETMAAKGGAPTEVGAERTDLESALISFATDDVGKSPKGWTPAETSGAGHLATWRVEAVEGSPNAKTVLRLAETKNSAGTFNLLLSDKAYPADLYVEVKIHANSGAEDQGGGVVWRAKDANNYYLARWNPLEDNYRVYKVENGKRSMFRSADVKLDASKWHEIKIEMRGQHIECYLDDKKYLECDDATFRDGGKVGLWTKADAASSFDALEIAWPKRK
jgi:hypothetical protein